MPNPAPDNVGIHFGLPTTGSVSIMVFDIQGRRVRQVWRGVEPAGYHKAVWNGRSDTGDIVASGIYFIRLKVGERTMNRRIAILR